MISTTASPADGSTVLIGAATTDSASVSEEDAREINKTDK